MAIFNADDRGNVVDFYEQMKNGEWEKVARLDREAGDDCNSLAWEDWSGGKELEAWAISQNYPIQDAERGGGVLWQNLHGLILSCFLWLFSFGPLRS